MSAKGIIGEKNSWQKGEAGRCLHRPAILCSFIQADIIVLRYPGNYT